MRKLWASLPPLLPLLLGGCIPPGGVHAERPDATLDFGVGWQTASACAQQQLGDTFSSAVLRSDAAAKRGEITVAGNYGGATIMVIDIADAAPGEARAEIHAHDYMLLWGGPTDRALAAMAKCRKAAS
ncbi:MAG TPA: hypothetical protein VFA23_04065 [Dongiaceae bacterium]|nr:hypothetical protein [Dongiaceae bacterium]